MKGRYIIILSKDIITMYYRLIWRSVIELQSMRGSLCVCVNVLGVR